MKRASLFKSVEGELAVAASYDSMLAQLSVAHDEARVSTRHGDTFAILAGELARPPLVLLHSANSASWAKAPAV